MIPLLGIIVVKIVVDFDKIKAKYLPWCYNSNSQHICQAFGDGISHPAVWFVDTNELETRISISAIGERKHNFFQGILSP